MRPSQMTLTQAAVELERLIFNLKTAQADLTRFVFDRGGGDHQMPLSSNAETLLQKLHADIGREVIQSIGTNANQEVKL